MMIYDRCWRCRCAVPNSLVIRRVVATGVSCSARGETIHYAPVSLCAACATAMTREAEAQRVRQREHSAAWLRLIALSVCVLVYSVGLAVSVSASVVLVCGLLWARLWWQCTLAFVVLSMIVADLYAPMGTTAARWLLFGVVVMGSGWRTWRRRTLLSQRALSTTTTTLSHSHHRCAEQTHTKEVHDGDTQRDDRPTRRPAVVRLFGWASTGTTPREPLW